MIEKTNCGTIYVVATPIGNLQDITLRAIEVLKQVDVILAEDTRKSGVLLKKHTIATPMKSYRDQNHKRVFPMIVELLQSGKNIGLISDSGTPLISDPGYKLIQGLQQLNLNVPITPVPGPSAAIAALSISGLPTDKFTFLGFLPKGSGKRKNILETFGTLDTTLILYESPFRVKKLLSQIYDTLGNRDVFVANELTKKFERTWFGNVASLIKKFDTLQPKGEFVVLVAKKGSFAK